MKTLPDKDAGRWAVACGCPGHGDHLACETSCQSHGCAHPIGFSVTAADEAEADRLVHPKHLPRYVARALTQALAADPNTRDNGIKIAQEWVQDHTPGAAVA